MLMKIDSNTALVLEGGGLRGVFTCGVGWFVGHPVAVEIVNSSNELTDDENPKRPFPI